MNSAWCRSFSNMDTITPKQRSRLMARVRSKDTKPELFVRSLVHRLGFRFRLHRADLPGKPDIVLTRHKKIIFVHGCFWHRHGNCQRLSFPATNVKFWKAKFLANIERDRRNRRRLRLLGWKVLVVWECEIRTGAAARKTRRFLETP